MGWDRVSGMLVRLGTSPGNEKVVSPMLQEQEAPDELVTLLLPEPQRVKIRVLHHEAQADRLACDPGQGLI